MKDAIDRAEPVARLGGADTADAYAVVEQWHPPARGAPLHFHCFEADTLLVVKGSYAVQAEGEAQRLGPAQSGTLLPGVAHAFAHKGEGAGRLLTSAVPAGIEDYFEAMSKPDWPEPDSRGRLKILEARFGIVEVQNVHA